MWNPESLLWVEVVQTVYLYFYDLYIFYSIILFIGFYPKMVPFVLVPRTPAEARRHKPAHLYGSFRLDISQGVATVTNRQTPSEANVFSRWFKLKGSS